MMLPPLVHVNDLVGMFAHGRVSSEAVTDLVIYTGLLLGLLFVVPAVLGLVRRRFLDCGSKRGGGGPTRWTLAELRELQSAGQITQEEFEQIKMATAFGDDNETYLRKVSP